MAKHRLERPKEKVQRAKEGLRARQSYKHEKLSNKAYLDRAFGRLEPAKKEAEKSGNREKYDRQLRHEITLLQGRNERLKPVTDRTRMQKITDATRHPFNLRNRLERINRKYERRDNKNYLRSTDRSRVERLVDYLKNPRLEKRQEAVERKLTRREILNDIRELTGNNDSRKPRRLGGDRQLRRLLSDALTKATGATAEVAEIATDTANKISEDVRESTGGEG